MGAAGRRVGVRARNLAQRVLGWEVAGLAQGKERDWGRMGSTVRAGWGTETPQEERMGRAAVTGTAAMGLLRKRLAM